jgi:glycosyltransferase involved in cell wall biosynthesis
VTAIRSIVSFSDHPAAFSGLARIHRDLATRIYMDKDFRIATLGYGSPGSSKLPFQQYSWAQRPDFIPTELPYIWKDFCPDGGVLFTIGDIQRFLPLADGKFNPDEKFRQWMEHIRAFKKLELWGYFPIDACSVGGKLGPQLGHTLSCYDRVIVPSVWAQEVVKKTLPNMNCDVLPHGIDTSVFKPYDRKIAQDNLGSVFDSAIQWPRQMIEVPDEAVWIGIVATNQPRKDWALGIQTVAELAKKRPVFLWAHTDTLKRDYGWSILELISDFGLLGSSMVTMGNLPDRSMALAYSACDVTLGIGLGEGFGYPIAESLACGVPCIHGNYAAAKEWLPLDMKVEPIAWRMEGPLSMIRPVMHRADFARAVEANIGVSATLPAALDWNNLWPRWAEWLKA